MSHIHGSAYRDKNGKLVYSLRSIRREYIRSGWFFINLLASLPASVSIVYHKVSTDTLFKCSQSTHSYLIFRAGYMPKQETQWKQEMQHL